MRRSFLLLCFLLTLAGRICAAEPEQVSAEQEKFFENDVRPILAHNCFKCHGEEKQKGKLRLDSKTSILAGGESGPAIVPGKPEESLLVEAIKHESFEMPPDGKLKDDEIATLSNWIKLGAPWPGDHGRGKAPMKREVITDEARKFWSFQPVKMPALPVLENDAWSRGAIDRFVLQRLRAEGLEPAAEAPAEMLVRRLYFDLTGLPPTPREVDDYVADPSTDKYERLVDRLLASPRYGERSARIWLDLVRYADSDGYKQDSYRPHMWRYRDYVIRSFNADKPYDQFVREQLAGDELAPHDPDALAATGYLRAGIYEYNAKDARTQWNFILNDITDVTADVFLGLGMSCARCHDHKFDPILQADYYRLRAFFANILPRDDVPLATPEERADYDQKLSAWLERTAELRQQIDAIEKPKLEKAAQDEVSRFPLDVQAMHAKPPGERDPFEQQIAYLVERQAQEKRDATKMDAALKNDKEKLEAWKKLRDELTKLEAEKPADLPAALTVTDVGPVAPVTCIPASRKGDGPAVEPGYLTLLDPAPAKIDTNPKRERGPDTNPKRERGPASASTTGRRTALANWLTSDDNPLVPRVIVNRLWQQHFGRGIVGTASDFGTLGERPSHPELLDYLASQLVRGGWHLKDIHREIVLSATYRQTALRPIPDKAKLVDPANRLLWRMNTRRLEAEQIRDAMLAVSGDLNLAAFGEGVDADKQPRRSIYTKFMRNRKDALLEVFDVADGLLSTPQRNVTTTAPQALLMINSDLTLARAKSLARRLKEHVSGDDPELVRHAYRLAYGRLPTDSEANAALDFLSSGDRNETILDFSHALLNGNEFLYVD
jgi:hypothetical protein